jgi:CspA family cold shock protein
MSNEEKSQQYQGVVLWFDPQKGYGFVKQDHSDEDIFLHFTNLQVDGFKTVKPNQRVAYDVGENHRGPQAVNVVVLGEQVEPAEGEDK